MIEFTVDEHTDFFTTHIEEEWGIVDIKCYGDSPHEINGTYFILSGEVMAWLDENTKYFEYDEIAGVLKFREQEDAMLFKLTWL